MTNIDGLIRVLDCMKNKPNVIAIRTHLRQVIRKFIAGDQSMHDELDANYERAQEGLANDQPNLNSIALAEIKQEQSQSIPESQPVVVVENKHDLEHSEEDDDDDNDMKVDMAQQCAELPNVSRVYTFLTEFQSTRHEFCQRNLETLQRRRRFCETIRDDPAQAAQYATGLHLIELTEPIELTNLAASDVVSRQLSAMNPASMIQCYRQMNVNGGMLLMPGGLSSTSASVPVINPINVVQQIFWDNSLQAIESLVHEWGVRQRMNSQLCRLVKELYKRLRGVNPELRKTFVDSGHTKSIAVYPTNFHRYIRMMIDETTNPPTLVSYIQLKTLYSDIVSE